MARLEPERAGDPNVAVLLTWLIPGAGHLYLGKMGLALAAFVVLEGLYLLGVVLSNGMFLEYLPPELRGRFAAALTPEVGNLGALLLHVKQYGYGESFPRPWPSTMDLGTALTASSGILNLFLMSRAHFDARLPERQPSRGPGPAVVACLTWLVPGAGHVAQGRRARGVLGFVLLTGLFFLGCWLAEGVNLDRERHFYYYAGQILLGPIAIAAEFVHGHPVLRAPVAYADAGVVLGCVAGMLNVLLMLDAYGYSEEKHFAKKVALPSKAGPEAGTDEAPATAGGAE